MFIIKKIITFPVLCLFVFCSSGYSQQKKAQNTKAVTPYAESSWLLGLCGYNSNAVAFTTGIEKKAAKHLAISYDIHYWKTNYENYCCDVYSEGRYSIIIPSVKIKFDPGKPNKGFFIGAGLGYVFAKDRGTEEPYSYDPVTKGRIMSGKVTNGNWDFNSLSPSFNWGVGFRIKGFPVSVINSNYFGKTTEGWHDISTGVGLKLGF